MLTVLPPGSYADTSQRNLSSRISTRPSLLTKDVTRVSRSSRARRMTRQASSQIKPVGHSVKAPPRVRGLSSPSAKASVRAARVTAPPQSLGAPVTKPHVRRQTMAIRDRQVVGLMLLTYGRLHLRVSFHLSSPSVCYLRVAWRLSLIHI